MRDAEIEAAEQHRQLGAVEHDAIRTRCDLRHPEAAARETMFLPIFPGSPGLTEAEQRTVVLALKESLVP